MTHDEIMSLVAVLQEMFDIVRVVDVSLTKEMVFENGKPPCEKPYECFAVWNKSRRCTNCSSAKALSCKGRVVKFEFVDHDVYFVISKYVEVDGSPYILEMVAKSTDETLWGASGKNDFIDAISSHTEKIYTDSLTHVYNRRYYDEQIAALLKHPAVALVDVDDFKRINDTYGHSAGDAALKAIAAGMSAQVRSSDVIIRYGGDEFLLIMQRIPEEVFFVKMEAVRESLSRLTIDEYPGIHVSVSIGAVYMPDVCVKDAVEAADKLMYKAKGTKNALITSA